MKSWVNMLLTWAQLWQGLQWLRPMGTAGPEEWKAFPSSKHRSWRAFDLQLNQLCAETIHHSFLFLDDCSLRHSFKETLSWGQAALLLCLYIGNLLSFCTASSAAPSKHMNLLTPAFLYVVSLSIVTSVRSTPKAEHLMGILETRHNFTQYSFCFTNIFKHHK